MAKKYGSFKALIRRDPEKGKAILKNLILKKKKEGYSTPSKAALSTMNAGQKSAILRRIKRGK